VRYLMKEKILAWGDDFTIRDESGREVFYVDGKIFSFGDKLSFRDVASIHGSYRKVEETAPALELAGRTLAETGVARCTWYLDQPVSNSGRLKTIMAGVAERRGWAWAVQIVPNPDATLIEAGRAGAIIASADSVILDRCGRWVNLAREIVTCHVPSAWVIDLSGGEDGGDGGTARDVP